MHHRSFRSTRRPAVHLAAPVAVTAAAALVAACLLLAPAAAAQERVGRAALVSGTVTGTTPGAAATALGVGDPIVVDHLIATGRASYTRLAIGENGVIKVPQETRLRIDRYRVEQATGETQSALSLLIGKIELALGSLFRGEVEIDTPPANLGVKGTVLRVWVDRVGRTLVAVIEGLVEVTSKADGTTVTLTAGQYTIIEPGGAPLPPATFDLGAATLSPAAGGPDFAVPGEDVFADPPLLGRDDQFDLPRRPPG